MQRKISASNKHVTISESSLASSILLRVRGLAATQPMTQGRLFDFFSGAIRTPALKWAWLSLCLLQRVRARKLKPVLLFTLLKWSDHILELQRILQEREAVREVYFETNFNEMSTARCLKLFRFEKMD